MTISTTTASVTLHGNGVTTVWPFSFKIPYQDDGITPAIRITIVNTLVTPNVATILSSAQYSVSGIDSDFGGTVTYSPALPTGWDIIIDRVVTYTQPVSILNQGFFPHTVESIADRIVMEVQQIAGGLAEADTELAAILAGRPIPPIVIPPGAVSPKDYGAFGDGTIHAITAHDIAINTQWIGTYPIGTSWDTVGFQEAIYACFAARSTPGTVIWNTYGYEFLNRSLFVPTGIYYTNQRLLSNLSAFSIKFESRKSTVIDWHGDKDTSAWLMNSASYGVIENIGFISTQVQNAPLWDGDHDGSISGLATQQITVYDMYLSGGFVSKVGVSISKSGGSAQGDTIVFVNSYMENFIERGYLSQGGNAIGNTFLGGDCQGCVRDGIAGLSGAVNLYGWHAENEAYYLNFSPAYNQIVLDGADVHVSAPTGNPSVVRDLRSESDIGFLGEGYISVVDNLAVLAASQNPWFADYSYHLGHLVKGSGTGVGGPKTFMAVGDSGTLWTHPTVNGSLVSITVPGAAWTINQWVGYTLYFRYSNGFTVHYDIASNTANTVTPVGALSDAASAATLVKIGGRSAPVTEPNWDICPQGYSTYRGAAGQGFTINAGSATLTFSSAVSTILSSMPAAGVGAFVVIPNADIVDPGVVGVRDYKCALIAKITAFAGGGATTATLDRPAGLSVIDQFGYYGAPLVDNKVSWIAIDYDAVTGANITGPLYLARGRTRYCGPVAAAISDRTDLFTRAENRAILAIGYSLETERHLDLQTGILGAGATVDLTSNLATGNAAPPWTPTQNTTINASVPIPNVRQEFTITILTSGVTSYTITFGTNFRSAGTLATGVTSGKKFVVKFESDGTTWNEVSRTAAL